MTRIMVLAYVLSEYTTSNQWQRLKLLHVVVMYFKAGQLVDYQIVNIQVPK